MAAGKRDREKPKAPKPISAKGDAAKGDAGKGDAAKGDAAKGDTTKGDATNPGDDRLVAQPWAPRWLRRVAAVLAGFYVLAVWLDAAGNGAADAVLPLPVRFFVQEAALFPHAARDVIEWRAEAWMCDAGRFEELDVRPYFPIRRDDKESRFYRAMFFHLHQRRVLAALDRFIGREQNRAHPEARIGGVMLLSLRIPIPPPGTPEERYQRLPLASYPSSVERHYWYVTDKAEREARCAQPPAESP
jgi:hypothetical protein